MGARENAATTTGCRCRFTWAVKGTRSSLVRQCGACELRYLSRTKPLDGGHTPRRATPGNFGGGLSVAGILIRTEVPEIYVVRAPLRLHRAVSRRSAGRPSSQGFPKLARKGYVAF